MSIRVVAKHFIKPEKLDEFTKLCKKLVESTNKEDWGCIHYQVYQDVKEPTTVAMLEEWESMEAIENHLKAQHFLDILPALRECLGGTSDITSYKLL